MDAKEALSILSDIARGKRDEEIVMMNPVSGEAERVTKKADNNTVIKAITEILKRYPTTKQAEKLQLEIEKLKSQIGGDEGQDEKIAGFLNLIKGAVNNGLE
ncbi:terminase small subunit [Streptococcus phage CHPC1084]|nr:terminase small subunit [Streptococcus phage CHPC1084]